MTAEDQVITTKSDISQESSQYVLNNALPPRGLKAVKQIAENKRSGRNSAKLHTEQSIKKKQKEESSKQYFKDVFDPVKSSIRSKQSPRNIKTARTHHRSPSSPDQKESIQFKPVL